MSPLPPVTWSPAAPMWLTPKVREPERLQLCERGTLGVDAFTEFYALSILPVRVGLVENPSAWPPSERCGLDQTVRSQFPAPCRSGSG